MISMTREQYETLPTYTRTAVEEASGEGTEVTVDVEGYLLFREHSPMLGTGSWTKPVCPQCGVEVVVRSIHDEWHRRTEAEYADLRHRIAEVARAITAYANKMLGVKS